MNTTDLARNGNSTNEEVSTILPSVDVIEDASGITLYADLPGVPKDRVNVRVEADTLSISGEINLPVAKEIELSHAEIHCKKFQRSFTLGQELDREKLAAEFKQGVLKLHIPKVERARPRKIEVNVT
jgi:HSP20 family molecular chaperone IbpA